MKKLIALLLLVSGTCFAANPSFQSFVTDQFDVTGNLVRIKGAGVTNTPAASLQGTVTNPVVSPSITGNGAGVTNVWIMTPYSVVQGGVAVSSSLRFLPLSGNAGGGLAVQQNAALPTYGYVSNMYFYQTIQMAPTTNFAAWFMTNAPGSAAVNSALGVTNLSATLQLYTNDSTHSIICTTNLLATIAIQCTANLPAQSVGVRWEWWHQSP